MRVSEIRVKRIRVNQGIGVSYIFYVIPLYQIFPNQLPWFRPEKSFCKYRQYWSLLVLNKWNNGTRNNKKNLCLRNICWNYPFKINFCNLGRNYFGKVGQINLLYFCTIVREQLGNILGRIFDVPIYPSKWIFLNCQERLFQQEQ